MSKGDTKRYVELEAMLITGASNAEVADKYPEIDTQKLEYQLPMFKGTTGAASLDEARMITVAWTPHVDRCFQRCLYCKNSSLSVRYRAVNVSLAFTLTSTDNMAQINTITEASEPRSRLQCAQG